MRRARRDRTGLTRGCSLLAEAQPPLGEMFAQDADRLRPDAVFVVHASSLPVVTATEREVEVLTEALWNRGEALQVLLERSRRPGRRHPETAPRVRQRQKRLLL